MRKMYIVALLAVASWSVQGTEFSQPEPKVADPYQVKFFKRQVAQNMSVGTAIRSIASHYPQDVVPIVDIALDTYPDKYREIIYAAISAQPASTQEIVELALNKEVGSCPSIVKLAIKAEPSYVDFVVQAAANATPDELDEIVRVAVLTEPNSADYIVQTLSREHPSKLVQILSTALDAVPYVGEYMVDSLLAIFPAQADEVVSTAIKGSSSQREQVLRILESAQDAGVADDKIRQYGIDAGFSDEELAGVLSDK
ncbi:hypothetical protein [Salinimonas iocasae]|uniref:HEAT repeat domain-containing protein n=1 Tax=Salinimonas iocasae TaxID=2572577 RepID=A0A5B7YAD0_9ALTE|nr:hypothetical protein [Salinimonas iocasae]QCZ92418.1 hypothetical protein FBQ74_02505 [Salinimonas iocasae]